jgi:decaprenyl-phosphate phosphoribosyltransferase
MNFLRLIRPKQWIKNAFVLAPLVFSGSFMRQAAIVEALIATLVFCVASSATYVLNDLTDVESDRLHPIKRHTRPLAAGTVTVGQARALLAFLVVLLLASLVWRPATAAVVIGYLALNVVYSLWLKRVPVVDLFCVAGGFVLRVFAGAVAIEVVLSSWMLITTLCLALYLAAIKRRDELGERGAAARTVLGSYTVGLLDRYGEMSAVGAIVFYSLFVLEVRPALAMTIPLVLFGLFRYWYIVEDKGGESPTDALWRDWPLGLTVAAWGAICAFTISKG